MTRAAGFSIGAATVARVVSLPARTGGCRLLSLHLLPHNGDPAAALAALPPLSGPHLLAATGAPAPLPAGTAYFAPDHAVEQALAGLGLQGHCDAVLDLGAEQFVVYTIDRCGAVSGMVAGNRCAAGTGVFFQQQVQRLGLSFAAAAVLARDATPLPLAGRCSVFSKSDCTHALNSGHSKGEIIAGLCRMIAARGAELLARAGAVRPAIVGGLSGMPPVIRHLRRQYPAAFRPPAAACFTALGASCAARLPAPPAVQAPAPRTTLRSLPPLAAAAAQVRRLLPPPVAGHRETTGYVGIDVGSTTTKAVLITASGAQPVAATYRRTGGDPVGATRACLRDLAAQRGAIARLAGIATTGSGRHLAALFCDTAGVVNEIIAHAVAAAHLVPDVDTIFEIGGQDAKYTALRHGLAVDYVMNGACSAGTGSFLEEAAASSLGLGCTEIAPLALAARRPLDFSDQCAAFIAGDIRTARRQGEQPADIAAGLVYAVCQNFLSRVKGSRPVGDRLLLQGGLCLNEAVPVAMAALTGRPVTVPPHPGLMGALGAALFLRRHAPDGEALSASVLETLARRALVPAGDFTCRGDRPACDLNCRIRRFTLDRATRLFGGICDRHQERATPPSRHGTDFVARRHELVFARPAATAPGHAPVIGLLESFSVHSCFPFYHTLFTRLGSQVRLLAPAPGNPVPVNRSSLCQPAELSLAAATAALAQLPDFLFVPQVRTRANEYPEPRKKVCVMAQAEPYLLRALLAGLPRDRCLTPVIDFQRLPQDTQPLRDELVSKLRVSDRQVRAALHAALAAQAANVAALRRLGREALDGVHADGQPFAIVLFGRPYHAFTAAANLHIPRRLTARGYTVIPYDLLAGDPEPPAENLYWECGQHLLRVARLVRRQPRLFAVYVTSFSCGPDSFLLSHFLRLMADKPSLILELDSHTATAGIDTRIDAALAVFRHHRQHATPAAEPDSRQPVMQHAAGSSRQLRCSDTEVLLPPMGRWWTEIGAACLQALGIRAIPLPPATVTTLRRGRDDTRGRECLIFHLTAGAFREYLEATPAAGRRRLLFMPAGSGPCRQGQYTVLLGELLGRWQQTEVGILALSDEQSYGGLGAAFFTRVWCGMLIADLWEDIRHALYALAADREAALAALEREWAALLAVCARGSLPAVLRRLSAAARALARLPLHTPLAHAPHLTIVGEIYARKNELLRQDLPEQLAARGFVVHVAPLAEFVYYLNYCAREGIGAPPPAPLARARLLLKDRLQRALEQRLRRALLPSGLLSPHAIDVERTMACAPPLLPAALEGEAVLTVGLARREAGAGTRGIISIAPFGCLPGRIAETILRGHFARGSAAGDPHVPYLHLDSEGLPFTADVQAQLDLFMRRAAAGAH